MASDEEDSENLEVLRSAVIASMKAGLKQKAKAAKSGSSTGVDLTDDPELAALRTMALLSKKPKDTSKPEQQPRKHHHPRNNNLIVIPTMQIEEQKPAVKTEEKPRGRNKFSRYDSDSDDDEDEEEDRLPSRFSSSLESEDEIENETSPNGTLTSSGQTEGNNVQCENSIEEKPMSQEVSQKPEDVAQPEAVTEKEQAPKTVPAPKPVQGSKTVSQDSQKKPITAPSISSRNTSSTSHSNSVPSESGKPKSSASSDKPKVSHDQKQAVSKQNSHISSHSEKRLSSQTSRNAKASDSNKKVTKGDTGSGTSITKVVQTDTGSDTTKLAATKKEANTDAKESESHDARESLSSVSSSSSSSPSSFSSSDSDSDSDDSETRRRKIKVERKRADIEQEKRIRHKKGNSLAALPSTPDVQQRRSDRRGIDSRRDDRSKRLQGSVRSCYSTDHRVQGHLRIDHRGERRDAERRDAKFASVSKVVKPPENSSRQVDHRRADAKDVRTDKRLETVAKSAETVVKNDPVKARASDGDRNVKPASSVLKEDASRRAERSLASRSKPSSSRSSSAASKDDKQSSLSASGVGGGEKKRSTSRESETRKGYSPTRVRDLGKAIADYDRNVEEERARIQRAIKKLDAKIAKQKSKAAAAEAKEGKVRRETKAPSGDDEKKPSQQLEQHEKIVSKNEDLQHLEQESQVSNEEQGSNPEPPSASTKLSVHDRLGYSTLGKKAGRDANEVWSRKRLLEEETDDEKVDLRTMLSRRKTANQTDGVDPGHDLSGERKADTNSSPPGIKRKINLISDEIDFHKIVNRKRKRTEEEEAQVSSCVLDQLPPIDICKSAKRSVKRIVSVQSGADDTIVSKKGKSSKSKHQSAFHRLGTENTTVMCREKTPPRSAVTKEKPVPTKRIKINRPTYDESYERDLDKKIEVLKVKNAAIMERQAQIEEEKKLFSAQTKAENGKKTS